MQIVIPASSPKAALFHLPRDGSPALVELSMHYASPMSTDEEPLGFHITVSGNDEVPDVMPLVEMAANRAQAYVDKCALEGMPLFAMLLGITAKLDRVARENPHPFDHLTDDGTMTVPAKVYQRLQALMLLLVARSFGLATDEDEYNGFVPVWYLEPRELPVIKWHGTMHAAGNA